ncbi:MAG: serine hydrolase [Eubacteriales bacterium]|jgi:D-alanyl-D-alanine carboxypeptidase (penicillin-binding protein 5/6)|nr:D-alanyl-D-alanine carboxypeptidase [Clostridiales bacterium]
MNKNSVIKGNLKKANFTQNCYHNLMKNKVKPRVRKLAAFLLAFFSILTAALPVFIMTVPVEANITEAGEATAEDIGLLTDKIASAYLYNIENDKLIYSLNENEVIYPTSTVKIMTGTLAIEAFSNQLSREVEITEEMVAGVGGNNIELKAGDVLTIESLLYALLVGGANDAAQALAILVDGSIEAFVTRMNERARELGAENTYYTNPSGVHDDAMVTTVADTAKIALAAYDIPLFMEITSASKYVVHIINKDIYRNVYSKNYLISTSSVLKYYYKDAAGINSGYTMQGGYSIVTTASRDGLTYLAIVMGASSDEEADIIYSYTEVTKLLDYAFASYANIELVVAGEMICEIPVELSGTTDYVTLVTADSLVMYLPTSIDIEKEVLYSYKTLSNYLTAPVAEGQRAGVLTVMYRDEIVGNIDLVTTVTVARSEFLYTLEKIKEFATSSFFISTIIASVVITIFYILGKAIYLAKKSKHKGRF